MNCNNGYCYWQSFDQCCCSDEEGYKNAVPNTLDCPSALRKDFEEQLFNIYDECKQLLRHRNMRELIEIKKFIQCQRPEEGC